MREPDRAAPVGVAAEQRRSATRPARSRPSSPARRASSTYGWSRWTRLSERTPCVRQELVGVEHPPQQRLHPVAVHEREQPPLAHARARPSGRRGAARSGRLVRNQLMRRRKLGQAVEQVGLDGLDGQQRDEADERAHLAAAAPRPCRSGGRRRRTASSSFHSGMPMPPMSLRAAGDVQEVLEELGRHVLVRRAPRAPARARSPASRGSTCPSTRCRRPGRGAQPRAAAALRSNTPMLSSPRKPPWKTLWPSVSLRFTHHVKLSRSLRKTRSRKPRSATPADRGDRSCRRATPPTRGPAG